MRNRSLQSLGFSLLALAGCSLDQYSFNGRDGAVVMDALTVDALTVDALTVDALSNEAAVTDAGALDADALEASLDGAALDARDAAIQAPDVSRPDAMIACDPAELVPDNAVYVDSNVATSGDGGSFNPLKTITEAVAMLERGVVDRPIVLAPGIYDGPSPLGVITLDSATRALRIVGGFSRSGGSWSRSCAMSIESWILGGNVNQALFIGPSSQPVTIERVAVRTRANPAAGVSQYAIWIASTRVVTLRSVDVLASRGGDGAPTPISTAGSGTTSCNRTTCDTSASAGTPGASGVVGARATTAGRFVASMGFVASPGTPGALGAAGFSGRPGTAGASVSATCALCTGEVCGVTCGGTSYPSCGAMMQRRCVTAARSLTATAGSCGCGGLGGGGGAGGEGGRAAIALFVSSNATVLVENSVLRTGPGGNGSPGAVGGVGASGGGPSTGTAQSCDTQCTAGWTTCNCTTSGTIASATAGGAGTMGGMGGTGGTGGSGAGGSSVVVARVAGATVRLSGSTVTPGPGGMGGSNALGAAMMGESAAERVIP
jgi:hypothetical protein